MQDSVKQLLKQEFQNPKNSGKPDWVYTHTTKVENLSCGDEITFFAVIKDNSLYQIAYIAEGCSIMTACASIISEKIKNQHVSLIESLVQKDLKDILGFELPEARKQCGQIVIEATRRLLATNY